MPDYKELYTLLFRETTKAILMLQKAQQQTEELYISDDPACKLIKLKSAKDTDDDT